MIRIEQLDLEFFGHFTNKQFDFGKSESDSADFHIIYGVNEAGKTTFMESYLRLLYGFLPRNEPYAFRHGRANLQVSALLQLDGDVRRFQRKSTARNSLVDELGNVLPEASLQAHLGGLAMDDYRKLLCIDDDSIDKGGEEIVNSRGDIGTLLFSAAAGISDLWQVLESAREKAEAIHKPRGSKTRLALLKKEYNDVVKKIKILDIPAGKLGQYTKALKKAELAEAKALDEQRTLIVDVRQLERVLNALPMLERLDNSEQAVGNLEDYPKHIDITSKQVIELQNEQHQATAERERLQLRRTTLEGELELLPLEPAYAGLDAVIEGMSELHSRYRHAELELDNQQEALATITTRMTTLVREQLHHDMDPDELVIEASVINALKHSLVQRDQAAGLVGEEQESIKQLELSINAEESKLEDLEKVQPEGAGLGEIVEQYNAQALSGEFKAATQVLHEADQKVEEALDILSIKGQRFSQIPECQAMVEEVETQLERWQALNTTLVNSRERQQVEQQELKTLTLESNQLESLDGMASDQDTQALKDVREDAWKLHKESLTAVTAEAFEPTLHAVDQAMEGRLAYASDLARLRDLHRQIPRVQGQLESFAESIRAAEDEVAAIEKSLTNIMLAAGIEASLPPKAVLNWVRSFHAARALVNSAQRLHKNHQPVLDKAQKLHHELSRYIQREQATLEELLPAASTMLEVYKRHTQALETCQQSLAGLCHKKDLAQTQLEAAHHKQTKAFDDWAQLVNSSFPDGLDTEKLSGSLDALSELRECHVQRETFQQQCKQMRRDKALFTEKLEQIISDNKLEPGATPDSNLSKLQELAAHAKKQVEDRAKLQKKIDQTFDDAIDAEKRLDAVKAQTQVLSGLFHSNVPTGDLTEIFEAVQKTQHARMLREKHEEDLSTLRQTLGVASEENARAMLAELDIPSVQAQQVDKESQLELVNDRSKEATEKRTRSEEQLASLTSDGEVAQLVERRTTLELQMSEASQEFLRLTLGHRLAERAINRYRDKHRSGMMQATERAFAELTDGKYSSLQSQTSGKEETLLAIDKDGSAKRADEMSKGTRFQLYLALRAAAYDQLAEQGTCLPFICDDIFETFDEDRTRAACRVMQRIGQRGQAIYLTHHRHVVDLAQEVCGDQVHVHNL